MATRSAAFVIRFRVEAAGRWWGEIQHVESGERVAFRDEEKMMDFLRRHLRGLRAMRSASATTPKEVDR